MCCPAQPPHRTITAPHTNHHHQHLHLHRHRTLGHPPTPSGFYALLGSSPSPPQGRPGELPLFLLVAVAPVASPSLVPLHIYIYIYTKFLRRLGSSLHSFLKKPWHAKAIFWGPGCAAPDLSVSSSGPEGFAFVLAAVGVIHRGIVV